LERFSRSLRCGSQSAVSTNPNEQPVPGCRAAPAYVERHLHYDRTDDRWMLFRKMPQRHVAEMTATMPVLATVLLAIGWVGAIPPADLALTEHGLMMPVMLVPMFLRLRFYSGREV
jgi:hypothetical protein